LSAFAVRTLEKVAVDPVNRHAVLEAFRSFFPDLEQPAGLRLLETRAISSGAVYLGFAAR